MQDATEKLLGDADGAGNAIDLIADEGNVLTHEGLRCFYGVGANDGSVGGYRKDFEIKYACGGEGDDVVDEGGSECAVGGGVVSKKGLM